LNRKYDDLYCKLFIDADVGKEELEKLLISYLNGSRKDKFGGIDTDWCELDVRRNEFFHEDHRFTKGSDSFLYFRWFLDIEPVSGCDQERYIRGIGKLVLFLKEQGYRAVAVCDFEEELPGRAS
jgi:hypothetical protein